MGEEKLFKGRNGDFILTDTAVIIKRKLKGFIWGGGYLRGEKTIPYSSIIAVQLKKAGILVGYLQLTLKGGSEAKAGWSESIKDENTITFDPNGNKNFEEAKRLIEGRIAREGSVCVASGADELAKLANLKEKKIITEEEFNAKKKQILGL